MLLLPLCLKQHELRQLVWLAGSVNHSRIAGHIGEIVPKPETALELRIADGVAYSVLLGRCRRCCGLLGAALGLLLLASPVIVPARDVRGKNALVWNLGDILDA